MNCFIFLNKQKTKIAEICETSPFIDLVTHLKNCGVTNIYSNSTEKNENYVSCDFETVKEKLGSGWLAAYSGCLTRQSPWELKEKTISINADIGVSLACSGQPWEHTTILTDGCGFIEKTEKNPTPENSETNLCFSNLVWVSSDKFDPYFPLSIKKTGAFLLSGYWKCPDTRGNFLLSFHDILIGTVHPWPHILIPENGIILNSVIPESTVIKGTIWVGKNCEIETGCTLENCVILDGAKIGTNSNLRNCLVIAGGRIPGNTVQYDKYLSLLGDEN